MLEGGKKTEEGGRMGFKKERVLCEIMRRRFKDCERECEHRKREGMR